MTARIGCWWGARASVSYLEEVEFKGAYANWSPGSCSAVWSRRDLAANLAAVFQRRQMETFRSGSKAKGVPLDSPRFASLADVIAFLNGQTDDDKLSDLLWALTAIDWPRVDFKLPPRTSRDDADVPFEFGVARLLVEPLPLVVRRQVGRALLPVSVTSTGIHPRLRDIDGQECPSYGNVSPAVHRNGRVWEFGQTTEPTTPDPSVFHELASGRSDCISSAVTQAARRLKSGGRLVAGYRNRYRAGKELILASAINPERLLAAMLFPLSDLDLTLIANSVLSAPE